MDFSALNFGVDGDSITAGEQWSKFVADSLGMASHYNVAVGSAVWYKRTVTCKAGTVTTQNYGDEDFAGISDGWEPTEDINELQKRMNNCAVVHIQRYISDVKSGLAPVPDIFAFAMGTNDEIHRLGDAEAALSGKYLDGNDKVDLFTEAGAMRWCLQRIAEEFPKVKIFVLTPIQTGDETHNRKLEKQIDTVMRRIAGAFGAQVIDCFHGCGICEKFEVWGERGRYLKDGLHPDVEGQQLEGAFAAKEIRNNMF